MALVTLACQPTACALVDAVAPAHFSWDVPRALWRLLLPTSRHLPPNDESVFVSFYAHVQQSPGFSEAQGPLLHYLLAGW
jgi:hypothetical protein